MSKKWDKKLPKLRDQYPEVKNINWASLINKEPEIFRAIVGNVAKSTVTKNNDGLSGKNQSMAQVTSSDYSELDFVDALNILWGEKSISEMVAKTKISHNKIYSMKRGDREPTFIDMEMIAESFDKDPSFFLEYRIGMVVTAIDSYLKRSPETATAWYQKVLKGKGLKVK